MRFKTLSFPLFCKITCLFSLFNFLCIFFFFYHFTFKKLFISKAYIYWYYCVSIVSIFFKIRFESYHIYQICFSLHSLCRASSSFSKYLNNAFLMHLWSDVKLSEEKYSKKLDISYFLCNIYTRRLLWKQIKNIGILQIKVI